MLAALAIALAPVGADAKSKAAKPQKFAKAEEILQWINDYRHKPDPERLPQPSRPCASWVF